jgi:hypothetical protein
MNPFKALFVSFFAGLTNHPTTTIFGLLIATCTGLSQVAQLSAYSTIFSCGAGIFTALMAVCAADAKGPGQ